MTNIRFTYMYRDASNYEQHGEAIFQNEKQLVADQIEKQVRTCLSDGECSSHRLGRNERARRAGQTIDGTKAGVDTKTGIRWGGLSPLNSLADYP